MMPPLAMPTRSWGPGATPGLPMPLDLAPRGLQPRFEPDTFSEMIARERVTHVMVAVAYQRVYTVVLLEDFPRSVTGKRLKRVMREPYWGRRRGPTSNGGRRQDGGWHVPTVEVAVAYPLYPTGRVLA